MGIEDSKRFEKVADEIIQITLDWEDFVDAEDAGNGDTISVSEWILPSGITEDNASILTGSKKTQIIVSGGTDNDEFESVDTGANTITMTAHPFADGDIVRLKTDGTLPGGLVTSKEYYVIGSTANTIQLSETSGGTAVDITSAGSGTHTIYEQGTSNGVNYTLYNRVTLTTSAQEFTRFIEVFVKDKL